MNVGIRGGLLAGSGLLDYAPIVARVEVDSGHLERCGLGGATVRMTRSMAADVL